MTPHEATILRCAEAPNGVNKRRAASKCQVKSAMPLSNTYRPRRGWWKGLHLIDTSAVIYRTDTLAHQRDTLGAVHFEISNHLGNVLAVVSDRKIPVDSIGALLQIDHFLSDRIVLQDYEAFGNKLEGRGFKLAYNYRFSFNGKEDVSGINWQDYGERMFIKNLRRFASADPLITKGQQYAELSAYQFAGNTPMQAIDLDGLEPSYAGKHGEVTTAIDNQSGTEYGYQWYDEIHDWKAQTPVVEVQVNNTPKEISNKNNITEAKPLSSQTFKSNEDFPASPEFKTDFPSSKTIIGSGLVIAGQRLMDTRSKFDGAPRGTSYASKYLRKALPYKMPIRLLGTKSVGGFAGRMVPYVGWGLLALDAISLGQDFYNYYKEQKAYDDTFNPELRIKIDDNNQ